VVKGEADIDVGAPRERELPAISYEGAGSALRRSNDETSSVRLRDERKNEYRRKDE
jgi:hypothetical protein